MIIRRVFCRGVFIPEFLENSMYTQHNYVAWLAWSRCCLLRWVRHSSIWESPCWRVGRGQSVCRSGSKNSYLHGRLPSAFGPLCKLSTLPMCLRRTVWWWCQWHPSCGPSSSPTCTTYSRILCRHS